MFSITTGGAATAAAGAHPMDAAAAGCTPDLEVVRPVLPEPGAQLQGGDGCRGRQLHLAKAL